ncbi:unnamed protein product [Closterium sp. NIES-54]
MAAQELRWLTYLLTDLGEQPRSPPVLLCGDFVIHPELALLCLTGLVFLLVPNSFASSFIPVSSHMVQYRPPSARADRFSQRAQWGPHLGIEKNYNAWNIFDVHSKERVAARDVLFYERLTLPTYLANLEENRDPTGGFHGDRHFTSAADEADWDEQNVDNASEEAGPLPYCSVSIPMDDENPRESVNAETYFEFADTVYVTPAEVNTNEAERIGPNFIPDPETGDEAAYPEDTTLPCYTQSGLQILGLVTAVHGTDTPKEPATVQQALGGEHKEKWCEAMDKELKALQERNTWKVVPIGVARNKTILTGKWVFRVKTKADGTIDKFKACWVVRGFDQEHGRDFTETFAPVNRHTSLRILLAIAAMKKKKLRQIDVANAFLYAPVDAEIFVELPHGSHEEPNQVCQLLKSLYGIKQASRLWQQYLHDRLTRIGFRQLPHDQGMYRLTKGDDYILLIVYVDDLLYIGSTDNVTIWFEGELQRDLTLTVSSTVTQYLGLNIQEEEGAIYLNATKYADTIAKRFALTPTTISTPYRYTAGNDKAESTPLKPAGIRNFQRKLGCLLFAAVTCHDLLYIGSTDNVTIWFEGELQRDLTLTVSSTVTQYLGLNIQEEEGAIYLNATKYADTIAKRFALTPTTISTPYRYTAGNDKAESTPLKPAGIRNFQRKLGCLLFAAVTCRPDLSYSASQLATYLKRPEDEHMKELDRALHYLEEIEKGRLELSYCPTSEMAADYLTKKLGKSKFSYLLCGDFVIHPELALLCLTGLVTSCFPTFTNDDDFVVITGADTGGSRATQKRRATDSPATEGAAANLSPSQVAALLALLQKQAAAPVTTPAATTKAEKFASAKTANIRNNVSTSSRVAASHRADKGKAPDVEDEPAAPDDSDSDSDSDAGEEPNNPMPLLPNDLLPPLPSPHPSTAAAAFNRKGVRDQAEVFEALQTYLGHVEHKIRGGDAAGALKTVGQAQDLIKRRFDVLVVADHAGFDVAERYQLLKTTAVLTSRSFKMAVADMAALKRMKTGFARGSRLFHRDSPHFMPKTMGSGNSCRGFKGTCFRCGQNDHMASACPHGGHGGNVPTPVV